MALSDFKHSGLLNGHGIFRANIRKWEAFELRQYMNGLVSVKHMFVFNLPHFFPHLHGKEKRAAISKQTCVSQKQIRSYIVLVLG